LGALLLAAAALGGCDDFMRAIGKEKVVPDEFAVVSRAPLAVPPDFSLRPPRIGALRPQEVAAVDQARQTVFRAGGQTDALPPAAEQRSPGETELLKEAGAANAPDNIRQLVETDATTRDDMSDSFVDKLAFWRKEQKLGPTDQVIDPTAEAQRLKDQKDAKSPDAPSAFEAAPTIEKTKPTATSSWLGWLF
jgi:hypothetical protein